MRFVSHIKRFMIQLVEPRVHFTQYGDRIVDREGYVARFDPDQLTEEDVAFAERVFERGGLLNGRTYMQDEVTPTPLINRLSVFDTDEQAQREHWDVEFKEYVEQQLVNRSLNHPDFRMVEEKPAQLPWPGYESFQGTFEDFTTKIATERLDPRIVLAYERQNAKRPAVMNALSEMIAQEEQRAMSTPEVLA